MEDARLAQESIDDDPAHLVHLVVICCWDPWTNWDLWWKFELHQLLGTSSWAQPTRRNITCDCEITQGVCEQEIIRDGRKSRFFNLVYSSYLKLQLELPAASFKMHFKNVLLPSLVAFTATDVPLESLTITPGFKAIGPSPFNGTRIAAPDLALNTPFALAKRDFCGQVWNFRNSDIDGLGIQHPPLGLIVVFMLIIYNSELSRRQPNMVLPSSFDQHAIPVGYCQDLCL